MTPRSSQVSTAAMDDLPPIPDPATAVARLIALLDVEQLETDLYRGQSYDHGFGRLFGGQIVAQALMAATRTVAEDRPCHSLHAYFIRPGDAQAPVVYRVERDRDGRSFSTRRIVAIQHGRPIFNMAASFQPAEQGLEHAAAPPDVPAPETLPSELDLLRRNAQRIPEPWRSKWLTHERPIEIRPVAPINAFKPVPRPPVSHDWYRLAAPAVVDPAMARALFAYASDFNLLDTCVLPHAISFIDPALQAASLDHAIWFYATPDLNDWLLFSADSPVAGGGRGLNRALVTDQAGRMVASVVQEGLIRVRKGAPE